MRCSSDRRRHVLERSDTAMTISDSTTIAAMHHKPVSVENLSKATYTAPP
jgi:hypothetical protein